MSLTPGFKKFLGLVVTTAVVATGVFGYKNGYFASKEVAKSEVIHSLDVPTEPSKQSAQVPQTSKPEIAPSVSKGTLKLLTIPWNATLGLQYANGGPTTTPNSLMAKHGVSLTIERQDMYDQMIAEQIKFAKGVAAGQAVPSEGAAFVIIMGDGYPGYIAGAQEALSKLGQQLQVIGAVGYSRGEDKCMLPTEVKTDPQKARGSLIGGVKGDGDINICLKWASDNGIPINPDGTTYDPTAMNFAYVDSFTKADDNLIAGYAEDRPVVSNGKKTGERKRVVQNGTATWTPGDVKVATMKGGMASVASTKEYMWQMPSIVIGNKQWMEQNASVVENFLAATFEGGELVRSNDAALTQAANTAAQVFAEESGDYWKMYFKGITESDKLGQPIHLGGSTTNGLGDNAFLFGLGANDNLYKRVYTVFGTLASKLYPDMLPALIPYDNVVNTKYIESLLSKTTTVVAPVAPTYVPTAKVTGTFAKRSYSIEFDSGKATFTSSAVVTLNELLDQLSISGLSIQVNGHTDNTGDSMLNIELSKKRAEAVKAWLSANAGSSFPEDRIRTRGYGDAQPVEDNATAAGKAKNRRVEVILLNTN